MGKQIATTNGIQIYHRPLITSQSGSVIVLWHTAAGPTPLA